jgi:hypothetical protein
MRRARVVAVKNLKDAVALKTLELRQLHRQND